MALPHRPLPIQVSGGSNVSQRGPTKDVCEIAESATLPMAFLATAGPHTTDVCPAVFALVPTARPYQSPLLRLWGKLEENWRIGWGLPMTRALHIY